MGRVEVYLMGGRAAKDRTVSGHLGQDKGDFPFFNSHFSFSIEEERQAENASWIGKKCFLLPMEIEKLEMRNGKSS
jgi:hypothetical protein